MQKLLALTLFACAAAAHATPIVYGQGGTQNTQQYSFTASATGDLMAYFVSSDAGYTNEITVLVNGVASSIQGLNNKTSAYGTALDFGTVHAGDSLVFKLVISNPATGVGPWYTQKSLNSDGINHVYASAYAGDALIKAGTYIGFEDLAGGGDLDYNDEGFVFTNVATVDQSKNVPEPASLALLGVGAAGFVISRRKRKTKA